MPTGLRQNTKKKTDTNQGKNPTGNIGDPLSKTRGKRQNVSKQRIGLVIKDEDHAQNKARELIRHIGDRCLVIDTQAQTPPPVPDDLICIVVLGGDGTFLSVARYIGDSNIPLMGIKFGEVGFLAETTEEHLCKAVDRVFQGDYFIRERSRLNIRVVRNNQCIGG